MIKKWKLTGTTLDIGKGICLRCHKRIPKIKTFYYCKKCFKKYGSI